MRYAPPLGSRMLSELLSTLTDLRCDYSLSWHHSDNPNTSVRVVVTSPATWDKILPLGELSADKGHAFHVTPERGISVTVYLRDTCE